MIRNKSSLLPWLAIFLSAFFAIKFILLHPTTPSLYTHMGVGRFILEQKVIPTARDISFKNSAPSLEWITHSWFSDVALYVAGAGNITFAAVAILITTILVSVLLILDIFKILKIPKPVQLFSLALGLFLIAGFWKLHPFSLSFPLILAIINLYLGWRLKGGKFILLTPLIFLAFANLSGGFIFIPGFFLAILFILETILKLVNSRLKNPIFKPKGKYLFLIASFILSPLASLINPLGLRIWSYLPTVWGILRSPIKNFSNLGGVLTVTNLNAVKFSPSSVFYAAALIYIIFVIGLTAFWLVRKRGNFLNFIFPVLPAAVFLALPFLWVNFIPLTALATLPLFALLLYYSLNQLGKTSKKLVPIILNLLFIGFLGYLCVHPPETFEFLPPKTQIDIIRENNLPANILTSIDLTGYAYYSLYPLRAGIDAQDDLFDEYELTSLYSEPQAVSSSVFKDVISSYNIDVILASKNQEYLTLTASMDPSTWALIYMDASAMLFVKRDAVAKDFLDHSELKEVNLTRNLGFNPGREKEAAAELEKFIEKYPGNKMAIGQLASIYRFEKNFKKAAATLNKIPQKDWDFNFKTEMGRIFAAQGLCKSAEDWFNAALSERSEKDVSRTVFEMSVLYAGCFGDKVKATHFLKRYISFPIPEYEREKAKEVAKEFGIVLDDN